MEHFKVLESMIIRAGCWICRMFQVFPGRWRLIRWLVSKKNVIKKMPPRLTSVALGYRMWIDPMDFDGLRYFIHGLNPREPLTKLISVILQNGDCMIDIGANVGYYTVLGSRFVGSKGVIHSFEASPRMFYYLDLVRNNPRSNVITYSRVVSDKCGEIEFYEALPDHSGISSIRNLGNSTARKIKVQSISLDSMLKELPKVKLIKIDVEGAELFVLKGMTELLRRDKPIIIMEITDVFFRELGFDTQQIFDYMENAQYNIYEFSFAQSSFIPLQIPLDVYQYDVVCIHQSYKGIIPQLQERFYA